MGAMNRVFLMGNLTRDPAVRTTPAGISVCDVGLAISEKYKNKEGEVVETTCFVDIVVWGRQAEACGQYLGKGAPVMVEGRLQLDQWQNDKGEKRSRLRVRADRVQFLGRPRGGKGDDQPAAVAAGVAADSAAAADAAQEGVQGASDAMPF